ncbi:c-type cytochrome [Methyloraptor flagellatus]|uniref:Cytochrome c n=1 Tax=Methyloraptor flagellatus TaxID=3162530 RepID=A0AAU7XCN1_9HYPH
MKRLLIGAVVLAAAGGAAFWALTAPTRLGPDEKPTPAPDATKGSYVFAMAGCASCHAAPSAKGDERLKLGGGLAFKTAFGTFYAPNISPDPKAGIGAWSVEDIVTAMRYGTSPGGAHYYPAFPYASYRRMTLDDSFDLAAYLKTLPAVDTISKPHEVPFPFNVRRGLGLWKLLFVDPTPVIALPKPDPVLERGRYLVEGPGHCGECHTPRNPIGGIDRSRWLGGAPALEGDGFTPDITPHPKAIGAWSISDIAFYLEQGLTPDGDAVGGAMAHVVENTAKLTKDDRTAIATYLKAVPAIEPPPKKPKS